jgi:hypothetical protein
MAMSNPFRERGMIRDPRHFFDRIAEVRTIVERLATMGSLSLVGDRQIGKSSLLFYVARQGWKEQPGPPTDADTWSQVLSGYELHYLDLNLVQSADDFYGQALDKLRAKGSSLRDFRRAIEGRKVVLFLDEFERATNNPDFPPDFFDALRGLAQTGELALVTATQTTLVDLVASGAIGPSPFYNIFARLDLEPLADDEARALLTGTAALAGVSFDDEVLDFAVNLAKGHPFRLQLIGRLLFEAQQAGRVNLAQVEKQFWEEFEPRPMDMTRQRMVSPNRSLLTLAGLFLVVAGGVGVFASLSGNLAVGVVSIGLIMLAVVLGGLSLLSTPVGEGS